MVGAESAQTRPTKRVESVFLGVDRSKHWLTTRPSVMYPRAVPFSRALLLLFFAFHAAPATAGAPRGGKDPGKPALLRVRASHRGSPLYRLTVRRDSPRSNHLELVIRSHMAENGAPTKRTVLLGGAPQRLSITKGGVQQAGDGGGGATPLAQALTASPELTGLDAPPRAPDAHLVSAQLRRIHSRQDHLGTVPARVRYLRDGHLEQQFPAHEFVLELGEAIVTLWAPIRATHALWRPAADTGHGELSRLPRTFSNQDIDYEIQFRAEEPRAAK